MQYSEHQIYFSNVEIGKIIDFQIINFTRPEGGDNTSSISPTDNAVKLFIWKSIYKKASEFRSKGKTHLCGWTLSLKLLILIRTMEKDA